MNRASSTWRWAKAMKDMKAEARTYEPIEIFEKDD